MKFTHRGLLTPPALIPTTPDKFRRVFVDDQLTPTRQAIYLDYQQYVQAFTEQVTASFVQWIGGSFTTDKAHPRDIDVLTILDRQVYQDHLPLIEETFTKRSMAYPLVDAYFLPWVGTNHAKRSLYEADRAYWKHHFGATRRSRKGVRHLRGYIELSFNNFTYE